MARKRKPKKAGKTAKTEKTEKTRSLAEIFSGNYEAEVEELEREICASSPTPDPLRFGNLWYRVPPMVFGDDFD